jgi:hypothetical protein
MEIRRPVIEVVDDEMAEVLRRKTGWERLKIVDALYRTAWELVEWNVRAENSDWDDVSVRRAVAERIAGVPLPERYFIKDNSREVPENLRDGCSAFGADARAVGG